MSAPLRRVRHAHILARPASPQSRPGRGPRTVKEGDSEAARQIIADAAAAIDALTYDEAKTLDENKAAVDAPADIADALAAQRAADKAAAETPDTPATPADEDDRVCSFCGERHDSRTFIGWVTEYFHDIFFILQKLFFLR